MKFKKFKGYHMKNISLKMIVILTFFLIALYSISLKAQEPYRAGTTAANFLEIGYGARICAMGDAGVAAVRDISSIYWNPAGLGYMQQNEFVVIHQPWYVGINASFIGLGYVQPRWGTFCVGLINISYSDEEVTTINMQEGTGEMFNGSEMAFSFSYGKQIVDWFSFGSSFKYITSRIWHETASAVAFDLGAIVNTKFLAWSDSPGDGLNIGMSISNYGTRMQYDGLDFRQTKDIAENEEGNYPYVPVHFIAEEWELPLIFRIGISTLGLKTERQKIILSIDALHPNNNSESINMGGEYIYLIPAFGEFCVRAGYKALFMNESHYGLSLGFGMNLHFLGNKKLKFDYAYRDFEILDPRHSYSLGIIF